MKSKKALLAVVLALTLIVLGAFFTRNPLLKTALNVEWIENHFPTQVDDDTILPFGYTLGPWPKDFQQDPIVTKLTYQKGPPQKFIESFTQVWKPVEVEVTISGPKTISANLNAEGWKKCFLSSMNCTSEKAKFVKMLYPEQSEHENDETTLTWFDSLDPISARGLHLVVKTKTYLIDRYAILTPNGASQTISQKTVLGETGTEARRLFTNVISSLKVKDDLSISRAWIQSKIKTVNLKSTQNITDPKLRFKRLIQIQNWIYSLLSVDPSEISPFFHLAGVTHLLAIELLRTDQKYFENQEAWILSFKPLFETLLKYANDFPNAKAEIANIEALLQDVLFEQSKLSH